MVGARAAVLLAGSGRPIGAHGLSDDARRRLEWEGPSAVTGEVQRVDAGPASLVLWTTPYAPFFGGEELSLLRALGDLTGLALDRTRLFAQERTARAALERADALKSSFVALAAHELRTPVAAVHGIAETLHRLGGDLSENRRTELRRMLYTQTTRLRLLVDQLLDLSRLDADAISIEPRRLRVRERVEELVADVAGAAPAPVQVDVAPDLEAPVDPHAFDRIVANLVANAVRYGSAPIVVRAELLDRHFRLTVEDRGPGVPTELVPQLFERFTRGDEARSRGVGTGLGLAIARSYAQAHDGELLYEPVDPHGACFQLVLPAR
jgi:two-component system sensor histidine kinase MtrB